MLQPRFPQRHNNHNLEQISRNFFIGNLPVTWNPNSIDYDYGIDLAVEIDDNNRYVGYDLIVQLKSSATSNQIDNHERQVLNVANYNYLWNNLRVAMLVKYIEDETEAYWILLKDIPTPNQNNETFTVYIPRTNRISNIDWNEDIKNYVREVTERKLNANRPQI